MARRRRSEVVEEETNKSAGEPEAETVEVKMRGPAESVLKRLEQREGSVASEKAPDNGDTEFSRALASPQNTVIVRRMTPREWEGAKINVEVWRESCPLTYQDIIDEISQNHGGRKYNVRVIHSETGRVVTADKIEIDADPILQNTEVDELQRVWDKATEPDASQISEQALEQQTRLATKQLAFEQIQDQLDSWRSKRRTTNGKGEEGREAREEVDSKIFELERRLQEATYQAKIEAIERDYKANLDALSRKIDEMSKAKPSSDGDQAMKIILQQMMEDRKASDRRFELMMQQMKDDKMNALLDEMKAIRNKPQREGSSMKEAVETFTSIATLLGIDMPGHKDDDGDEGEPREWWERLLDTYLPKVFDLFEERKKEGRPLTREEAIAEIQKAAKLAEDDTVARAKARITATMAERAMLPAPPPRPVSDMSLPPLPPMPPPQTVQAPMPAAPIPAPTPAPAGVAPAPPALVAARPPTVEEEIAYRVGTVLALLEREIALRPRMYQWNYEGAWNSLPESILEQVCKAPDPVSMLSVFATTPNINVQGIEEFKAKISADPKIIAWVQLGLDELHEWWAEKEKDPRFDPADLEDENEGAEE